MFNRQKKARYFAFVMSIVMAFASLGFGTNFPILSGTLSSAQNTPVPTPTSKGTIEKVTKLGVGVYAGGGHIMQGLLKAQPTIILLLDPDPDFARKVREVFPKAFIIGRRTIVNQPLDNPTERGKQIADYVAGMAVPLKGVIDAWQSYNEPLVSGDYDGYRAYNEFLVAFAHRLQDYYGIPAVSNNDAPGSISPGDYPKYFGDAIKVSQYFGVHAYAPNGAKTMRTPDADWYVLRYRKIHDELVKAGIVNTKFVITESGLEGGWKGKESDQDLANDLMWLSDEMNQDPYVIGQAAFGIFGQGLWPEYDLLLNSNVLDILGTYTPKTPILTQDSSTPGPIVPRAYLPIVINENPPVMKPRVFLPFVANQAPPSDTPTITPTETLTATETVTPQPSETPTSDEIEVPDDLLGSTPEAYWPSKAP